MSYARIEHAGGALSTTLATDITSGATSLSLTAGSTWPTGAVGPFYLVIDPATSSEEKILATARSSNSLTGLTRGVDGTSAAAHSAGAVIKHIFSAVEADEANLTVNKTLGAIAAKGDLLAGSAANTLTKLAVGTNGLPLVANSAQTPGLNYAALTATGLGTASVTTAKIAAGAVTTTELGAAAVTLPKFSATARPIQIVANATALNALTPIAGDAAFQADTQARQEYTGTVWVQTRRRHDSVAYTPSGTEQTGSNATWPVGLTGTLTVPPWATHARLFAKIGQAWAVTSVANCGIVLYLGTLAADTVRIRWDPALISLNSEQDLTLVGDVDCTAIANTSVVLRTLANNVSGGALRVGTESSCYIEAEFR